MNMIHDQKIEVRPSTLNNLFVDVMNGHCRIPRFQREYIWNKSKVIELFDSIYFEYPIGSFFLWKAGRQHNNLFRHAIELDIPPLKKDDDVTFILDGQQRITSLYATLSGQIVNSTDYSKICFDLKNEKFTFRTPDNNRYVALCDIWGPKAVSLMKGVDESYIPAFEHCFQTLRTYPISIVEVRDKDLPAVCKIFQRINQSGKRLDRFDLISAMTFSTDFDLRERFTSDLISRLIERGFGKISPVVVTQLMALIKRGACTERHEYSLTTDDIKGLWDSVIASVLLSADTLRKGMGVIDSGYLPYDAILTLLAYYFAKSGNRSLPASHMEWIQRWFWRASFAQHYGAGGPTRMGRDKELLDDLIDGGTPNFNPPINFTVETLVGTKMTWIRSAVRNAFLCLLASRDPIHLVNNSYLDLVYGGISDFTSSEKHHIFPRAFLHREGPAGAEIQALPNFCFLPAELNKRISDSEPASYLSNLEQENPDFLRAARTHLIPIGPESGIAENDYLKFLKGRGQLILEEIGRLCGTVTTPREEERQIIVEKLETRIRDIIHNILIESKDDNYWKVAVPQGVRDGVEMRISAEIDKYPDRKPADFTSHRSKFDYCNVMDYMTIIENGANWSYFEKIFRKKSDLQHYLKAFSEYRNAVVHSREMTELARLGGEMAMIWLENVLPTAEETEQTVNDISEVTS